MKFNETSAYMFTFAGIPDVSGFWSLTVYNMQGYLVDNYLSQYSLGDRSNLTYPDGTPVYGNEVPDGSAAKKPFVEMKTFQILLQPADNPPPATWTSNSLPSPSGHTDCTVSLRIYGPKGGADTYVDIMPAVEKVLAIH